MKEKIIHILKNISDFLLDFGIILLVSIIAIIILISILRFLNKLLNKYNVNKKFKIWLIMIFNFLTFNMLKKITNEEDLNKINMILYDALDEEVNKDDKEYKEIKNKMITGRIEIPDSLINKEETKGDQNG